MLIKPVLDCGVSLLIHEEERAVEQKDMSPQWIVNPADRAALETAMRMKESLNDVQVLAVSYAHPKHDEGVYYALARGADRGIHIIDDGESTRDAFFVANALAKFLAREKIALILCGNLTIDFGTGSVGPFIAEYLDIPQLTSAVALDISSEPMEIIVQRRLEKGNREVIACPLPAVVAVDPKIALPTYVSVCALGLARQQFVERVEVACLGGGIQDNKTKILKLEPPRPRPKRTFIPDSTLSAAERMKLIASGGMVKKKESHMLTGAPEDIAEGIFKFLQDKGFVN